MPPAQKDNVDVELRRVRNRELELKRITGEISCAECRRLKLKCDKKVPCSSCVRRGCKQVCPTETSTGSTGRQIANNSLPTPISNGNDVTRKLTAMSERIRALEDAVQIQNGNLIHPLLSPELLAIKQGIDVIDPGSRETRDEETEESLAGAFGTLSVSGGKTMRFLGASAADSALLMEVFDPSAEHQFITSETLPKELVQASRMWPFTPAYLSQSEHIVQLVSHLPPYERVTSLLEAYFSNLAWFIAPIDRSQVIDEIIPLFYPQRRPVSPWLVEAEKLHDLALLFIVFACGAVADLTQPAINVEAESLQQLSRAALGMRSFIDYGSLAATQTLLLMAAYEVYAGRKTSQESSWKCMSIGMTIAASIGLHRDPSRWKLDAKMVNWRRRTFWEMNSIDKWKSLGSGRPPSFPPYTVDCEFPLDRGATVEEDGVVVESVWQWRYRFSRDVLPILVEKICAARPPKYSDIMEMDRVVRDFELHPFVHSRPKPNYAFVTDGEYRNLHPYITLWWQEMALIYIHRNCFARAMLEYRSDPMRSPFAPSFLSAYRAATTLLELVRAASERMSLILDRLWALWAISLNCAVIVGSVACRASTINFAASALNELEKAIVVFEAGSKHPVARNGIKLLYRLRDKANAAFEACGPQSPKTHPSDVDDGSGRQLQVSRFPRSPDELLESEEELNILRGTTRYVEQRPIPTLQALQDAHARTYLTYDTPSSSSSVSSGTAVSPNMNSYPTTISNSPDNSVPTPSARTRESTLHTTAKPFGADALLGPSSLVRSPPDNEKRGGVDGTGSRGACISSPAMQANACGFDDYLPPFVECGGVKSASTQASKLGGICEEAINARCDGRQPQHSSYANQDHTSQFRPQQPDIVPPISGAQNSFTPPEFPAESNYTGMNRSGPGGVSQSSNLFTNDGSQPFPLLDPTILDPTDTTQTFFSGPLPDPQVMAELNALYQKEDATSAQAWNSFMQQFELVNAGDAGYGSWEAMVFS